MADTASFVSAYGVVVKTVSEQVKFLLAKGFLGTDGKFGLEDLPLLIGQLVPLFMTFDDVQVLFANKQLFLDPSLKADLQASFAANFDLSNDTTELLVEEIHDIVLSVLKMVVKLLALKEAVPAPTV